MHENDRINNPNGKLSNNINSSKSNSRHPNSIINGPFIIDINSTTDPYANNTMLPNSNAKNSHYDHINEIPYQSLPVTKTKSKKKSKFKLF